MPKPIWLVVIPDLTFDFADNFVMLMLIQSQNSLAQIGRHRIGRKAGKHIWNGFARHPSICFGYVTLVMKKVGGWRFIVTPTINMSCQCFRQESFLDRPKWRYKLRQSFIFEV